ncbi:MAG: GNAT family N-acetyltransferase [Actinobacteria bacterium RBG_13_35_12]|nr:MAG: GNAT family N-acetyltransferase [Actinobacteria bacterium RBG_13_35_12]
MKKRIQLKTDRLLLRPFELSDAPRVKELAGDKAIADTTLNIPYPYKDGMAEQWISTHQPKFESGELANYAIILKSTKELVGAIGLNIEKRFNRAELGYWIGKEYWNQDYCTEASKAMLEYGFRNLGLNKIIATHITRNPASGEVMKKIGMKKEGFFREHVIKWKKYEDIVSYGILKKEWKKHLTNHCSGRRKHRH